jgi:hypothetical protein
MRDRHAVLGEIGGGPNQERVNRLPKRSRQGQRLERRVGGLALGVLDQDQDHA